MSNISREEKCTSGKEYYFHNKQMMHLIPTLSKMNFQIVSSPPPSKALVHVQNRHESCQNRDTASHQKGKRILNQTRYA